MLACLHACAKLGGHPEGGGAEDTGEAWRLGWYKTRPLLGRKEEWQVQWLVDMELVPGWGACLIASISPRSMRGQWEFCVLKNGF